MKFDQEITPICPYCRDKSELSFLVLTGHKSKEKGKGEISYVETAEQQCPRCKATFFQRTKVIDFGDDENEDDEEAR